MPAHRRQFLGLAAAGAATLLLPPSLSPAAPRRRVRAILFDAFPVFDPRPIADLAETLFPGRGAALSSAWRTRQFEYSWLRAAAHRYEDFWKVTEDALIFAAKTLPLEMSPEQRAQLMNGYLALKAYPEALPALRELKAAGCRLAFLSNFTPKMLEAGIKNSGLEGSFDEILSTDRARTYKPDPRAYQIGLDAFQLRRDEMLFVPSAGWDAAGARWFGYPTFWVNRQDQPREELGIAADATGKTLTDLVDFVQSPAL